MQVIQGAALEDRDMLLLAFAVRHQGAWSETSYERLWKLAQRRWHMREQRQLDEALRQSMSMLELYSACLILCQGKSCTRHKRFADTAAVLQQHALASGVPIVTTSCHGPCKQAPIATLKLGPQWEVFSQFHEEVSWATVLDYASAVLEQEQVLPAHEAIRPFRYDAGRGDKPSVALLPLQFLLGRFAGKTARDAQHTYRQESIVEGQWEAGGRYLALRTRMNLFIDEASPYVMSSMLMLGVNEHNGALERWGFTNSGTRQNYTVTVEQDRVALTEQKPAPAEGSRFRRVFLPRQHGWEEYLESNSGDGFTAYAILHVDREEEMRKPNADS